MAKSHIEWTEMTWNPTTGCDKISAGCKFCYAEVMTRRLKAMGQDKYKDGFKLKTHDSELNRPYTWKKPSLVFVNSMSDLFHEDVPFEFIEKVFNVMNECTQHRFQVLTKRADRLAELSDKLTWGKNIWMGVSVENQKSVNRIDYLRYIGAKTKFLSLEPLIGPLPNLNLENIDWVIVGGESGMGKIRPIKLEWILDIKEQCDKVKAEFFFKQWGGKNKKLAGREINGETFDGMPKQIEANV
jgi:protein gp37